MDIRCEWRESGDRFDVKLAKDKSAEEYLTIKGCRLVEGRNGTFVSWPASKMKNDKWFTHIWANEKFSAAVLEKAQTSQQRQPELAPADPDDDVPF